jgi:hypothetical protein
MKYLISLILILTPIDAHARGKHHSPGAPPAYQQEYAGELKQDADQHFTGAIRDLYSCVRAFSISTAQKPWVATMPYTDSCGDLSPNDMAEQINLWPNPQTGATFSGI